MRWIRNALLGLTLVWIVGACLKQPDYSVVPQITLQDLTFIPGNIDQLVDDTLIITLGFKDGDGDLGLGTQDSADLNFDNPWYFFYDSTNYSKGYTNSTIYQLPGAYKFIDYKLRKTPQFDTLPDINCTNWEQLYNYKVSPAKLIDTIYIQQNVKAFNINVDIYYTTSSNPPYNYTKFDPATYSGFAFPNCNVNLFRAAFPNLSSDEGRKSPLEGTLTYKISSANINFLFSGLTLKVDIQINDRAFNYSNIVSKEGFTLASITK